MATNNRQRMINTKFWSDSFVVDKLNPLDRYLFLYFLTNEKTNLSGVYELPIRTIANETGLEKEEVNRMLDRLRGKVEYKNGWVCLVNFMKHQNTDNSSIVKGIENRLNELPKDVKDWVEEVRNETSGIPVVDERGTTREQLNLTKLNLTKPKGICPPFELFWIQYPEKIAKAKALQSWNKLSCEEMNSAIQTIAVQIKSNHFRGHDGKSYIPHPATWLNQKRWEDEIKQNKPTKTINL